MAAAPSNVASYGTPCAACKFLRRKCIPSCIFAPYFPPEDPQKFANVHKIFGASNISKLLNDLLPQQRDDAVNSLAYEAEARVRDPVYGCIGAISYLQMQVERLQKELDAVNAALVRYATSAWNLHHHHRQNVISTAASRITTAHSPLQVRPVDQLMINTRAGGGRGFYNTPNNSFLWCDNVSGSSSDHGGAAGQGGI